MIFTGRFLYAGQDFSSGKQTVTFSFNESLAGLDEIKDIEILSITAEPFKKKRSLDANSYFHVLVSKIADTLRASKTEIKNQLIREYGQYEYIAGSIPTLAVDEKFADEMLSRPDIHLKRAGYVGDRVRLAVMRGSHTYDSKEMAILIDGAIQEAKELGIETLPPAELERMMNEWERRHPH